MCDLTSHRIQTVTTLQRQGKEPQKQLNSNSQVHSTQKCNILKIMKELISWSIDLAQILKTLQVFYTNGRFRSTSTVCHPRFPTFEQSPSVYSRTRFFYTQSHQRSHVLSLLQVPRITQFRCFPSHPSARQHPSILSVI